MNQAEVKEKQEQLLKNIQKIFDATGYLNEWSGEEENNLTDILRAEHPEVGAHGDEVMGEYYFLPSLTDQAEVLNFVVSLTLSDSLTQEAQGRIVPAITKINSVMPLGGFVLDQSWEILSYRYVISFFPEEDEEMMVRKACYYIAMALQYTALWIDALLDLEAGKLSVEAFFRDFSKYYADGKTEK